MPSHTRRGACGTMVCVGFVFVLNPRWYADRFVLAGAVRRLLLLLLLSVFIRAVGVSVGDSIKLGEVLLALAVVGAVGEMSCGSTGCLSCRGKQSTSSSSSSSSGRSLLFSILS